MLERLVRFHETDKLIPQKFVGLTLLGWSWSRWYGHLAKLSTSTHGSCRDMVSGSCCSTWSTITWNLYPHGRPVYSLVGQGSNCFQKGFEVVDLTAGSSARPTRRPATQGQGLTDNSTTHVSQRRTRDPSDCIPLSCGGGGAGRGGGRGGGAGRRRAAGRGPAG